MVDEDETGEDALMRLEGADVQYVDDPSVVRWLVAHGKGDAVRRQLSSRKEVELHQSFATIADPVKEMARPSDRPQTISAGDLHRTLDYLGLGTTPVRHNLAVPPGTLNFQQFVQVVIAEQFGSSKADSLGASAPVLDVLPIMARAFDVRRMVDRSGTPWQPAPTVKGAKPTGPPAHRRGTAHAHARADAGGSSRGLVRGKGAQPKASAARVWDAFNTYEDSYATYKQLRTEYDQRWFGKEPAGSSLGERADSAAADDELDDDTFEEVGGGGPAGRQSSEVFVLPAGYRRRRVVGGPMSRSLAALGTRQAAVAASATRHAALAPARSGGVRMSASAPSLSEAASAPHTSRPSARAAPGAASADAHDLARAGSTPLLSVHAARRGARSKVLPALEDHDAGAGRQRWLGAHDSTPRLMHARPDSRHDQAARQEVHARMQAWRDMRDSTRETGPHRATTLRMGRDLHARERVYFGHLNPLPIGGDGIHEFYS
jgi:hypothetical protein